MLLSVCFVLGLLITVAEPDLQVLAAQVSAVMNGTVLVYCVGIGVGAFLVSLCSIGPILAALALGLIVVFFLICQVVFLKLPARRLKKIAKGVILTCIGLVKEPEQKEEEA